MITLKDTFNNRTISRHRSVDAAVKARAAHSRMIRRLNGSNSYVWYSIRCEDGSCPHINDEIMAAQQEFDCGRGAR